MVDERVEDYRFDDIAMKLSYIPAKIAKEAKQ